MKSNPPQHIVSFYPSELRWSRALISWGLALLVFIALAALARDAFRYQLIDDAFISFRYARNLVEGHGLTFNPGEYVEGYSNFLWTMLIAFALVPGIPAEAAALWLGGLLGAGTLLLLSTCSSRREAHLFVPAWILPLFVAAQTSFAWWAVSGLETALMAFFLVVGTVSWSMRECPQRTFLVSFSWSVVVLTRADGIVYFVSFVLFDQGLRLWSRRRSGDPGKSPYWGLFPLATPLATFMTQLSFRLFYYGEWVSNTAIVKTGGGVQQKLDGLSFVAVNVVLVYLPVFALAVWLGRRSNWRHHWPGAWGVVVASIALLASIGGDWSRGRLFAHALPCLALAAFGWWNEHCRDPVRPSPTVLAITAMVIGATLSSTVLEIPFLRAWADVHRWQTMAGRWLAETAPPDTLVVSLTAGMVPYYSRLPTIDALGLCDAHIARQPRPPMKWGPPGHEKFDLEYCLSRNPAVFIECQAIPGFLNHPRIQEDYLFLDQWRMLGMWVRKDLQWYRREAAP